MQHPEAFIHDDERCRCEPTATASAGPASERVRSRSGWHEARGAAIESLLTISGLTKRYRDVVAVRDVSLDVAKGELFCLLGPSGCGKTTLLHVIAGLALADAGTVTVSGRDITRRPPQQRNIGFVFQNYALFPHLTVAGNIAYGLEARRRSRADIAARVAEMVTLVRLEGKENRLPKQLSGGEQQRVALARALAIEPDLLLLDEPFSNLDAKLRAEMRVEVKRVQTRSSVTAVFVTHDQEEAFAISDRIAVMRAGVIEQSGEPDFLYRAPASEFVARFIGESGSLGGTLRIDRGEWLLSAGGWRVHVKNPHGWGAGTLVLRPEHVRICAQPREDETSIAGTIVQSSYRPPGRLLLIHTDAGDLKCYSDAASATYEVGTRVIASWKPDDAILFDAPLASS